MELEAAIQYRECLLEENQTLVFTNGHFDLLHVGHLDYLEEARELGDALFVGINDDQSTRRLKGKGRPIVPAVERIRLLEALVPVTGAIVFEEETANHLIKILKPELYVKGGDYYHKELPERSIVESYGGQVVLIDFLTGYSTTNLIAKIKALPD